MPLSTKPQDFVSLAPMVFLPSTEFAASADGQFKPTAYAEMAAVEVPPHQEFRSTSMFTTNTVKFTVLLLANASNASMLAASFPTQTDANDFSIYFIGFLLSYSQYHSNTKITKS